jgi:hypothetical protein
LLRTDGRSIYQRHGGVRYATHAQLFLEERMLALARATGAPRMTRADAARTLGADLRQVPHRRQLRQPHPVSEPAGHPPGYLAGQPRLAGTPRPGHRHQPVLTQMVGNLVHHPGPAHETSQRGRKAVHASRRVGHRRPLHSGYHNRAPPLRYTC